MQNDDVVICYLLMFPNKNRFSYFIAVYKCRAFFG